MGDTNLRDIPAHRPPRPREQDSQQTDHASHPYAFVGSGGGFFLKQAPELDRHGPSAAVGSELPVSVDVTRYLLTVALSAHRFHGP
jgi:hypothetical protein